MTAHRAQGQTLSAVIVDLQSCRGSEALYVMLSHVTSIKGLLILRSFSRNKITCNVSEDLRVENKRLREIVLETTVWCSTNVIETQAAIDNLATQQDPVSRCTTRDLKRHASRTNHIDAPLSE
ncbi:uncharacterized protein LACBIDRAFT_302986 [Laccaria bicolor S238N-H82]|uniref:Predicted protein n=1 Tax=Laccaria bicolor (strain S238N-H82 / ATCC MYA-4686) TaxID=486041 RepID=B0DIR4_LACBS|nr:uncharacterized protein LACBIDRAFT_302986 [Laccaria bicolor S238N-H82]EDR05731.1 predicted protein [Laccaria bicolor S238N-H82]|eukprot:XP_001883835.1 predicted protein [Laccaria bicolor S238N-H82]